MRGSGAWAKRHLGTGKEKLAGALILDEVGWKAPQGAGVQFETYDKPGNMELVSQLGEHARAYAGGDTEALRLQVSTQPYGSDHMSFLHYPEAVPKVALLINTFDRDYPHYHQKTGACCISTMPCPRRVCTPCVHTPHPHLLFTDTIDSVDFDLMSRAPRRSRTRAQFHTRAPPTLSNQTPTPRAHSLCEHLHEHLPNLAGIGQITALTAASLAGPTAPAERHQTAATHAFRMAALRSRASVAHASPRIRPAPG